MNQNIQKLPKSNTHFLSLVVPVYKQANTIIHNLRRIKKVLDTIKYDYEIVVVVDGIVDSSHTKIIKANFPKVKCLVYSKNAGKSFAIRQGMHSAKGDYVMFLDSGLEIDPLGISMLLEHMEWYKADIIVGSKRHPASLVEYSLSRKILSQGYYYIVKFLFNIKIHDTQAGIKIFKKEVLREILPRVIEKKFAGDLEMLVVADYLGFKRIYEAPIKLSYYLGGVTSAATFLSIIRIFKDTLSIFYRRHIGYYRYIHRKLIKPDDLKVFNFKAKPTSS